MKKARGNGITVFPVPFYFGAFLFWCFFVSVLLNSGKHAAFPEFPFVRLYATGRFGQSSHFTGAFSRP